MACSASARRSPASDVRTVPLGSANATTSASTADPRRARRRNHAARRASRSPTSSTTSHVFRNRLTSASRPACPSVHSTSTMEGTTGGHSDASRSAAMSAAERRVRGESAHATRMQHQHAWLSGAPTRLPPDARRAPPPPLRECRRLPDAIHEPLHIAVGLGRSPPKVMSRLAVRCRSGGRERARATSNRRGTGSARRRAQGAVARCALARG